LPQSGHLTKQLWPFKRWCSQYSTHKINSRTLRHQENKNSPVRHEYRTSIFATSRCRCAGQLCCHCHSLRSGCKDCPTLYIRSIRPSHSHITVWTYMKPFLCFLSQALGRFDPQSAQNGKYSSTYRVSIITYLRVRYKHRYRHLNVMPSTVASGRSHNRFTAYAGDQARTSRASDHLPLTSIIPFAYHRISRLHQAPKKNRLRTAVLEEMTSEMAKG
jgi:hypothetical protein